MDEKKKSVGVQKRIYDFLDWLRARLTLDDVRLSVENIIALVCIFCIFLIWYFAHSGSAQFAAYLLGGLLFLTQIQASSKRAKAAEDTAAAMQKTANLTEKGNVVDRFKNAIEHLGHESPSIRLGGIYALHHIAQDEDGYRERVFEILCAHIRAITTKEGYIPESKVTLTKGTILPSIEIKSILNLLFIQIPDREIYEGLRANLDDANLMRANLRASNLQNARFFNADLQCAGFVYSNLQESRFYAANLYNALFIGAELQGTNFLHAILWNTNFTDANLQRADLSDAKKLTANQLLKAKTLYQAKLPDGMEAEIRQHKPELFENPNPEKAPQA